MKSMDDLTESDLCIILNALSEYKTHCVKKFDLLYRSKPNEPMTDHARIELFNTLRLFRFFSSCPSFTTTTSITDKVGKESQ